MQLTLRPSTSGKPRPCEAQARCARTWGTRTAGTAAAPHQTQARVPEHSSRTLGGWALLLLLVCLFVCLFGAGRGRQVWLQCWGWNPGHTLGKCSPLSHTPSPAFVLKRHAHLQRGFCSPGGGSWDLNSTSAPQLSSAQLSLRFHLVPPGKNASEGGSLLKIK